jgi:hypothetical protein
MKSETVKIIPPNAVTVKMELCWDQSFFNLGRTRMRISPVAIRLMTAKACIGLVECSTLGTHGRIDLGDTAASQQATIVLFGGKWKWLVHLVQNADDLNSCEPVYR